MGWQSYAFSMEQLRKKGTITDENAELVSYREGKYSNEKQNDN